MRIAFIGPPGAGKSTQTQRLGWALSEYNHSPRISTGDLIQAQIQAGTDLGREMQDYYDRGEPVPDNVVLPLVFHRLRRAGGWILDDFPASGVQARALDEDLRERGSGTLNRVISLEGPSDAELIERILSGRLESKTTGISYHLVNDPPPGPGERQDPGPFARREDDTEEAIRTHLAAYHREAEALKGRYEKQGILSSVNAAQPIEAVAEEILDVLDHPEKPQYYAV